MMGVAPRNPRMPDRIPVVAVADPYEGMDDTDKWHAIHDEVFLNTGDRALAVAQADKAVAPIPKPPRDWAALAIFIPVGLFVGLIALWVVLTILVSVTQ